MKTIRLVLATGLALVALAGIALALTWWQPATARAEDAAGAPAAPQTLPPPWLSDDDVADAPYGAPNIWPPPAVDGLVAPGEYAGAGKVTFPGYGGDVEVFIKQDAITLYIALDSPDTTPYPFSSGGGTGPAFQIFLDTANDKASAPQADDYRLTVNKGGNTMENRGNGTSWAGMGTGQWNAKVTTAPWGWQAEFAISFAKLGITPHVPLSIGLGLAEVWTPSWPHDWYWPEGGHYLSPATWGILTSSSDWSTFYWKPGPWEDYAPSGMPDFDQNQLGWLAYDGPAAVANSFWWFDSKFEPAPYPPKVITDHYRLVTSYGNWDDHYYSNAVPLIDDLATNYLGTNQGTAGTDPISMFFGIHDYLRDHGLWDDYIVTLVEQPDFRWVADEVMRSEDVILLLGFYEWVEADQRWSRVGGHYVNVAGVDLRTGQIAFSDPSLDATEMGMGITPPGRVLSGTLIPHQPIPGHTPGIHNDAGNVSHDVYGVVDTNSPGGIWGPAEYPLAFNPRPIIGANPNPRIPTEEWGGTDTQVEVELAIAVSPYTWKASGEWLVEGDDPVYGTWQPWQDYAPNGVPDFDQRQDNWGSGGPPPTRWTYCGPVAAANSLWWFDSKFEPNPVGPPLPPYQPPIRPNDNYPLVTPYGPWDDHDPLNVEDQTPALQFVDDLALHFDTDGLQTGSIHAGTIVTDLYNGIEQYITDHGLRQGYVITQVKSPDFWWVAEEVERSEDVILLLGFWQFQSTGQRWVRLGGHYVTLPGVDKQGGFVAFSDPFFDRIERTWPYAGIGTLPGWPSYMGRVADGWLQPHRHPPGPPDPTHNDAGNVSHDVYRVIGTDSPGGVWGPEEYVNLWIGDIENFWGQNGGPIDPPLATGDPVQTEVDWAVAVSPVADVGIQKTVSPAVVVPGEWVTFTIAFGNVGNTAEHVVISDVLPPGLINARYTYTLNYGGTLVGHDTFTWTVGTLHWREGGVITVTAQVDPNLAWPAETMITNTAAITTKTPEQHQVPAAPNSHSASFTVQNIIGYGVDLTPDTDLKDDSNGHTVAYTFTVRNTGTVSDSYNLSLANDDWPTALSTGSVGPLNPNGSASVHVSVTVPVTAVGSTFDRATVTAQSVTSPTVSDTSAFTTTAIDHYVMHMDPSSASLTDNPGKTVTYTLVIHNGGNITDTYDLTHTLAAWTTSLSKKSVGPVGPWSNESFQVYVTIPGSALDGARDVVTVTADSRHSSLADDSVLTTVATTQIITRGVAVAPHAATGSGDPGDTVTYTLRVTNTGSVADVIALSHTGPSTWTVGYSANPLSLGAGVGIDVAVTVGIPPGAAFGSTGVITVTATTQGSPPQSDGAVLTTNVSKRAIYLPLVMRTYSP